MRKILLTLLIFQNLYSEPINFKVEALLPFTAKTAIGLILAPDNTQQVSETNISNAGNKTIVSFTSDVQQTEDLMYSAILISEAGEVFTTPLNAYFPNRKLFSEIPICQEVVSDTLKNDLSMIDKLVSIREKRLENRKINLHNALNDATLEKIAKYEKSGGYNYANKLSADSNPQEISNRLNQVLLLVQNFNLNRKKDQ